MRTHRRIVAYNPVRGIDREQASETLAVLANCERAVNINAVFACKETGASSHTRTSINDGKARLHKWTQRSNVPNRWHEWERSRFRPIAYAWASTLTLHFAVLHTLEPHSFRALHRPTALHRITCTAYNITVSSTAPCRTAIAHRRKQVECVVPRASNCTHR